MMVVAFGVYGGGGGSMYEVGGWQGSWGLCDEARRGWEEVCVGSRGRLGRSYCVLRRGAVVRRCV